MIRLILFLIIFVIFLGFIVLNLNHSSDISFGFITFSDIPVFLSILSSFMLGMLFAIPLSFALRRKKPATPKSRKKAGELPEAQATEVTEITREKSPYGID